MTSLHHEYIEIVQIKAGIEDCFMDLMKKVPENYLIEVTNLTKRFGEFTAVDNISFNVKQGEIFGFLGPTVQGKRLRSKCYRGY